jgi:hypothetical protein
VGLIILIAKLFSNDCTGGELREPIDLGRNPVIRTISLSPSACRPVAALLKSLLSHLVLPNLERINLIFERQPQSMDLRGWEEMDAILDSERFIALRRVVLYATHRGVDDPWLLKLSEKLHSLNSKDIMHVHSSKVRLIHS